MNWIPAVKRSFDIETFEQYVHVLPFHVWRPQFIVLHNTGVPRLDQWHQYPVAVRMNGLEHYYRDVMQWHAGPHLFVSDTEISVFTPLTVPGVHSPSWNAISWGVEMVGDFTAEAFDPKVKTNAVAAIASLCAAVGMDSHTLRLHKEDPATTHKECPGIHVDKQEMIDAVHALILTRHSGEHSVSGALPDP